MAELDPRQTPVPNSTGSSPSVRNLLGRSKQSTRPSSIATARNIARRAAKRIVDDSVPNTQPIPLVAVLKGTQYQAPVVADAKTDAEARMILDLAVDLGTMMLRAGAGSNDVEASVVATCTACGLSSAEIDLTSNSLTLHYTDPDARLHTVMRVNRGESIHFAKISAIHALVSDLVSGKIGYLEARERLDAIRYQRRPYPLWFVDIAWGVLVMTFVYLVGGSWVSSLLGFIIAISVARFGGVLAKTNLPSFFIVMIQTAATTFLAQAAAHLHLVDTPQYIVAAGVVLLLPTLGLVSAVQDALTKFPLTAAARMVEVMMTFAAIVSGIAVGIILGSFVGLREIEVIVSSSLQLLSVVLALVSAFFVSVTAVIGMNGSKRSILPVGILGLFGFMIMLTMLSLGVGGIVSNFVTATVVGFCARPLALRLKTLPMVIVIPCLFPLLAGLAIFSAAYKLVQPEEIANVSVGMTALFSAITVNAALAVGAVFGDFLARPMTARRVRVPSVNDNLSNSQQLGGSV